MASNDKPVVDFGQPISLEEDATPKPGAEIKPKPTKMQRRLRRYARSLYAIAVASLPIVSFGLTISSLVSASWGHKPINADDTKWIDISPVNGNCTCDSTHVSYCAETGDAFEGTAYLSVVVMGSETLMALIYAAELGLYGLFGGSHNFTRITLIVALLALSTEILSVISWYATFANNHCGDPSFQSHGASLGWPFFVRCVECAGMLGFVLYITSLFPKTNRGPPSIPLVSVVFALMLTCVTTFLRGWMVNGEMSYSPWSACVCGESCSNVSTMMSLALGCGAVATLIGFITVFFMSLRAVDNEGMTLKVASATSAATVVFQVLVVVGFYLAYNGGCGSSLADEGFQLFWPSNFAVAALCTQIAFFVGNTVYMMKACCDVEDPDATKQDHELTIFYRFWWDHLKDPRTLAHEAREEDEDDNAGSESDDDGEDAEALPPDQQVEEAKSAE
jgi:hypothetical protein